MLGFELLNGDTPDILSDRVANPKTFIPRIVNHYYLLLARVERKVGNLDSQQVIEITII